MDQTDNGTGTTGTTAATVTPTGDAATDVQSPAPSDVSSARGDLAQLIADWRADAAVLRRRGVTTEAQILERCADQTEAAAVEYLTLLTESEAILFSGQTSRWLRSRFPAWESRGNALRRGRTRYYRQLALPRRTRIAQAYADGRRAAGGSAS